MKSDILQDQIMLLNFAWSLSWRAALKKEFPALYAELLEKQRKVQVREKVQQAQRVKEVTA